MIGRTLQVRGTLAAVFSLSNIVPIAKNDELNNPVAVRRKVKGIYERIG